MKRRQSSYPLRRRKRNPNRSLPARFPLLHCEPLEERRLLAVLTVNSELDNLIPDDGLVTLREAIIAANSNTTTDLGQTAYQSDQIVFTPSLNGKTIALSIAGTDEDAAQTGDLDIIDTAGLRITGNGRNETIIDARSIDRVFDVPGTSGWLLFEDLTITGGSTTEGGGAIRSQVSAEVTIIGSTIRGNSADGSGGGVQTRAERSYGDGNITVSNSTIFGNSAGGNAGGISASHLTVTNSTISGNSAVDGGGGLFASYGNVTVSNTAISDNLAGDSGGGIFANDIFTIGQIGVGNVTLSDSVVSGNSADSNGGGISAYHNVTVSNSTISGNSASSCCGGGIFARDDVTMTNSTISGNSAMGKGGGIWGSDFTVASSIVAGNIGESRPDFSAVTVSATNSLVGDNSDTELAEAQTPDDNGNLIGSAASPIDPLLGPLQDNGGPTFTHALLPGSPAINIGDPSYQEPLGHDQRGALFARVSAGRIDMGAFEAQIAPVDFNDDDLLNCADIDALMAAIVDGDNSPEFDLTGDTIVDQLDRDVWLSLAGLENLPSHEAYPLGDADLDGKVDAQDLNVVAIIWLENVTGWCSGDFTADGVVDARDLNELGLNWLEDLSDEAAAVRPRAPRAALAQNVAVTTSGRLDLDVSLQSAKQISERIQAEQLGKIAEKTLDQIMRRRSRRYAVSSESRPPSAHHEEHELSLIDQCVDSVLKDW